MTVNFDTMKLLSYTMKGMEDEFLESGEVYVSSFQYSINYIMHKLVLGTYTKMT